MTTSEILAGLKSADDSTRQEVFIILSKMMVIDIQKVEKENAHMSAQLSAIKKINRGKNEAIDALCERD